MTVAADGCAKLVDFGEAIELDMGVPPLKAPRGTMSFMAPEILYLRTPLFLKNDISHSWRVGGSERNEIEAFSSMGGFRGNEMKHLRGHSGMACKLKLCEVEHSEPPVPTNRTNKMKF